MWLQVFLFLSYFLYCIINFHAQLQTCYQWNRSGGYRAILMSTYNISCTDLCPPPPPPPPPPTEWEVGHIAFGADPVGVPLSPEPMGGFWPNSHRHIIRRKEKSGYILVTLTSFSRSHQHFEIFKFWQKKLVCTLSLEPNNGFWPNFIYCNVGMV